MNYKKALTFNNFFMDNNNSNFSHTPANFLNVADIFLDYKLSFFLLY